MPHESNPKFLRLLEQYVRQRISPIFPPREAEQFQAYLKQCLTLCQDPPRIGRGWRWGKIADTCGIDEAIVRSHANLLIPILVALREELRCTPIEAERKSPTNATSWSEGPPRAVAQNPFRLLVSDNSVGVELSPIRRGRRPKRPIEFPEPLWLKWNDPASFREAMDLQVRRHGETCYAVHAALTVLGSVTCSPEKSSD